MKKFSVLIIVCAIILTIALVAYNQTMAKSIIAKTNHEIYSEILDKSDLSFKDKAIAFTPFEKYIEDGKEKEYIENIIASSDMIEGYISPSAVYYVTTPVYGGNAYISSKEFFDNCLKEVDTRSFNFAPLEENQITVVLGNAYKDRYKVGESIAVRIKGQEDITLKAKITDILDNNSYDPVNQIQTYYGIYVGDLSAIVGEECRKESEDRVYSILYSGKMEDVKVYLSQYGFADDSFNYFYDVESFVSMYDNSYKFFCPVGVACAFCMAAAFVLYASVIFFNLKKSDSDIFKKTILSLVFTVLIAVIYIAISFGKIAIPSAVLSLIPYIFTLAILIGICIAGNFKKEKE